MERPVESGNDNRDSSMICQPVSSADTNGNTDNIEENDNLNINEAGSEDSGMSSVDNHNLPGRHPVIHTESLSLALINTVHTHRAIVNNNLSVPLKTL